MKDTIKNIPILWKLSAASFLLGCFFYFCVLGCSFSGLILWCLSALAAVYQLLNRFQLKTLRKILTVCVCIGLAVVLVTGVFVVQGSFGHPQEDCAYVVILGAGVNGSVPSLSLQERINAAYDYLIAHPNAIAIPTGGQGNNEDITESYCIARELIQMGIDPSRIWQEDKATSTWENLNFSLDLIEDKTGTRPERIGLVSSEYHLFRAGLFARELGVQAIGIPGTTTWLHLRINYFLREIAGVWHYILLGG